MRKSWHYGLVHTTPEKFENGVFTLKTHQMFSVHTAPEEFENATITGHFGVVAEENLVREITSLSWCYRSRKVSSSKCLSSTLKHKAGVFKFLRFEERFRKASFSWRISVDGRPNRRNKAAFSNFSGAVWMGPQGPHTLKDMLRGREARTSVSLERMLQGQYVSWCTRNGLRHKNVS